MPIKELDQRIRMLPRIGKIKIGEKALTKEGKEYPKAVDYFICPPEVHAVYGEKPRKLEILLPHEDIDITIPHWYKLYGKQRGLICKGNGETASWKHEDGIRIERECPCEYLEQEKCKRIGTLNFILPKVEGFGAYQIVTSSFYSIINILDYLELLKSTLGKISFIPLSLVVKMEEFNPTVNGKQMRTVNPILHLVLEESFEVLAQKAKAGTLDRTIRLGLPGTVELEKADSDDEIPEELYPNLMEGKQQKELTPDPDAEKIIEINKMFGELGYPKEEINKFWEKYPKPAELHQILIYIIEIDEMFKNLDYSIKTRGKVWKKYPEPQILHQKLKEVLELQAEPNEDQESDPEQKPGREQSAGDDKDIPTKIEVEQTIPLF